MIANTHKTRIDFERDVFSEEKNKEIIRKMKESNFFQ